MSLLLGLLFIAVVVFQWFTQEVTVKIFGPWQISFFRDEWPAFYWIVLTLELGLGALCVYYFFA